MAFLHEKIGFALDLKSNSNPATALLHSVLGIGRHAEKACQQQSCQATDLLHSIVLKLITSSCIIIYLRFS